MIPASFNPFLAVAKFPFFEKSPDAPAPPLLPPPLTAEVGFDGAAGAAAGAAGAGADGACCCFCASFCCFA